MTIGINNVQQVSITIPSGSTTGTATINPAVGTFWPIYQGNTTSAATNQAESLARVSVSGTTVTATRALGTAGTCVVNAVIIDADSSLIKSVQQGTITGASTATISSVTTANAAVALMGYTSSATTFDFSLNTPLLTLTNATTVTATDNSISGTGVAGFCVIEFQGAALNQSIQKFSTSFTPAGATKVVTIASVNVNNSMLILAGQDNLANETNATDQATIQITGATAATITLGVNQGDTTMVYNFAVVEFVSGVLSQSAQRGTIALSAATSNTATITSAATALTALNNNGWRTATTAITSYATILPRLTQTSATVATAALNTAGSITQGWEALTFTQVTAGFTGSGAPTEAGDTASGTGKFAQIGSGTPTEANDSASGTGNVPGTGLIFPAYIYPGDPAYSTMISLMGTYPKVPVVTVFNPNSGPGTSTDPNYTTEIAAMIAASSTAIGYVNTQYATISQSTVEAQIALWQSLYPAIQGIFLDNMDNTTPNITYYVNVNAYIKSLGMVLTVGNAGTATIAGYYSNATADVIIVQEVDGAYPTLAQASNSGIGTANQRATIATSVPFNNSSFSILENNCKYVWATNRNNDYGDIPDYLELEFKALTSFNTNALQQAQTFENSDTTGTNTGNANTSGIGSPTEANDTASGTGKETLTGTGTPTESGDAASGSGSTTGGSTTTGSGAPTEASDTAAGTGTETIKGSAAINEAGDTASGSGTEVFTGIGAATETSDTDSGTGNFAGIGSGASTEAPDTASGSGNETFTGTGSPTEANDTASGTGTYGGLITGSGAPVEASDTSSASGKVTIISSGASTEAGDTASASGMVVITGAGVVTEAGDSALGSGLLLISSSGASAEANDNAAGTGMFPFSGTGAATEASDTASGSGKQTVTAIGASLESGDVAVGVGKFAQSGIGTVFEQSDAAAGIGTETITGNGSSHETNDTASGMGSFTTVTTGSGTPTEANDNAVGLGKTFFHAPRRRTFYVRSDNRQFKC